MLRTSGRTAGARQGQSTVELALILPVLLMLVLGMMDFGRLVQAYLTVQHAAREGARLAITGAGDGAVEQRVRDAALGLDQTQLTVTVDPPGTPRYPGTDVTVTVHFNFRALTPVLAGGGTIPIGVTIIARVE